MAATGHRTLSDTADICHSPFLLTSWFFNLCFCLIVRSTTTISAMVDNFSQNFDSICHYSKSSGLRSSGVLPCPLSRVGGFFVFFCLVSLRSLVHNSSILGLGVIFLLLSVILANVLPLSMSIHSTISLTAQLGFSRFQRLHDLPQTFSYRWLTSRHQHIMP